MSKDCRNREHSKHCKVNGMCVCGISVCSPNFAYHVCTGKSKSTPTPLSREEQMSKQLTTTKKCTQKTTYYSYEAAHRAAKRKNKSAGYNYLRSYKCNVCDLWHHTTQSKEAQDDK